MVYNQGKGFLVLDQRIHDECMAEVFNGEMLLFQKAFTVLNLKWNRVKANTLQELAKIIGARNLVQTIDEYNLGCDRKKDDQFGKQPHLLSRIDTGPFYAIWFDSHGTLWPTPFFTLGGLDVDQQSGQVRGQNGQVILGLFAAGRAASGVCSKSYVSGLSLADCVFSGRRSGHYIATGGQIYAKDVGPVPRFTCLGAKL